MAPHGFRTQLGGSIRNRNSLPIVLLLLFSCSVVSDSLRPHELQHVRLPCPSLSLRVCSNSCALSWWCHPTISSSVALLSSCPESFPASVSWLFASGGQSIGASASASALPMNIQGWFPLGLTGLILTCSINMLLQKRSQMCHIHTLAKKKKKKKSLCYEERRAEWILFCHQLWGVGLSGDDPAVRHKCMPR